MSSRLPNPLNPLRLRQIWTIVESSQASLLVRMDDSGLEEWLMRQFRNDTTLSMVETQDLQFYIHAKLPLIRDMASQKIPAIA